MRILVLSSKGRGTGCVLRALSIARAFEKQGHHVTFLPPFPTLPLWFDMALDMVFFFIEGLFRRADVAIGIKPYPTLVPALWWQKWVHGARIVLDVDDLDYDYSRGLFRSFHRALQLPWPRRADLVTYHNPHLREPLAGVFGVDPARCVSLPQGVETGWFRRAQPASEKLPKAARRFLAQRPKPLLIYTAHLNGACGLSEILASLVLLLKDRPDTHLLVAGGGPDEYLFREEAERRGVAGHVTFTGQLEPPQVAACLNLADLALVYYGPGPANDHRSSMKLREALASGVPVVATNVGENATFGRHVHLSAPDPAAFARCVLSALKGRPKPALPHKALEALKWEVCIRPLERRLLDP